MYSLCTLCLTEKQQTLLDSFHIRCLRSIASIPSTWGATVLGIERVTNEQIRCNMNVVHLSDELRLQQLTLLGHILRRPPTHPARVVTFNRFAWWAFYERSAEWNDVILQIATTMVNDHDFRGAGVEKYVLQKLFEVAQNRNAWSDLLKTPGFLGAAHGMLLAPHGSEKHQNPEAKAALSSAQGLGSH